MKILFTGASSFTGFWFVQTLAAAGHEVICPLRGGPENYDGVRKLRVDQIKSVCRLIPQMSFGSEPFLKLIREGGPWDLFCHHATETANYKSADFDVLHALQSNTLNLRPALSDLKSAGVRAVILTGSVFENDEGAGGESLEAFSGYGLSKSLTWQMLRFYCHQAGISAGKFVIPNPFGPYEEPRFTAHLVKHWRAGKVAEVKTPDYLRDNIPVDLMSAIYLKFAGDVLAGQSKRINPSGYVETQGEFAQRVAREVRARTGWACELKLARQEDFSEPLRRTNTDPAMPMVPGWNEPAAWNGFVDYYTRINVQTA